MAYSVPVEVWRTRVVACLSIADVASLRNTCRALGTSLVTAEVLLGRIDAFLDHKLLCGVIDIDRRYGLVCGFNLIPWARRMCGRPSRFSYFLRWCLFLEQGGTGWRTMGVFLRIAVISRLFCPARPRWFCQPTTGADEKVLPIVLSAQTVMASEKVLPLMMAFYSSLIGHRLRYKGDSLAMRQKQKASPFEACCTPTEYLIQREHFRVPWRDDHSWDLNADSSADSHSNEHDPAIQDIRECPYFDYPNSRCDVLNVFPSFSAFLLCKLLLRWSGHKAILHRLTDGSRLRPLLDADFTGEDGIAVDYRSKPPSLGYGTLRQHCRIVIVSGFRSHDTVAAHIETDSYGLVRLTTTEPPAADASSSSLDARFPVSMPLFRQVLRRVGVERDVMDGGLGLVDSLHGR
ncbi:unnamed protein product [Vitrella brassicaformis CCMP3155]|uniref:Uncharacterized protein n=3 Tax=Vitrella brassicaformis TaxID=1169539 RepID=A0A0G4GTG0_VITBC|nr:unnamed protein product [Vitrella brassicaformis CCMP3155]|eukprot:CEM34007.1 unnamed protein product [Vitrella brassicaformis CCMP3155]